MSANEACAVQVEGLSKTYRSPWTLRVTAALQGVDMDVPRGEVLGLLGPNGAGKTTMLKILTGLLRPTRGRASIFGIPIEARASRRQLGFLPERPYFYDHLNGPEFLELAARLSGLHAHEAARRAAHWMGRVGLGDRQRLRLHKYSKGMLQRLGLAAALIHDPELVILDEPMSGLDPFGRRDVRDLIVEQRERGVTVLFSSHILPDVEMVCDRVAILRQGHLVSTGTVAELVERGRQRVEIRCRNAPMLEIPAAWRQVLHRFERPEGTTFHLDDDVHLNDVVQWLIGRGASVAAVTPQRGSLEELFLAAVSPDAETATDPMAREGSG